MFSLMPPVVGGKVLTEWPTRVKAPSRFRLPIPTWRRKFSPRVAGNSYQTALVSQQGAGTLFNTYTTAKTVINPQALCTLPAGFFYIGKMLHIFASGGISNIVTTPGLLNFQVKIGSAVAFDTGNIQLNATAHTTLPFWFEAYLTCRSVGNGTNATLMGLASVGGIMITRTAGQTDDAQGIQAVLAPATAPAVGAGFDSTIANILDFWVGFTISNAGNGIQIQQYKVTDLN